GTSAFPGHGPRARGRAIRCDPAESPAEMLLGQADRRGARPVAGRHAPRTAPQREPPEAPGKRLGGKGLTGSGDGPAVAPTLPSIAAGQPRQPPPWMPLFPCACRETRTIARIDPIFGFLPGCLFGRE